MAYNVPTVQDMVNKALKKTKYTIGEGGPVNNQATSVPDMTEYYKQLEEARLKKTLAALKSSRNSQLGALDNERSTIQPYYQTAGLQARGQSGQGARSFADYLASKGLSSSGVAAQGEINRQGTLQGTLGNLGQQETQALSGIAQRESDVNNSYSSDVSSAKAGAEADTMQALIQQQQLDQARQDSQRQLDAENELTKTKYADTQAANEKSSFLNTIGQYSNDFTAQKNAVLNDNDPTNDWQAGYFAAEANKKRADAQAKYDKQGYVSEDIAKALGLPVGTMSQAYKEKQDEAKQKETVNNAIQMFGQLGYLTPQMVEILRAYGLTEADITRASKKQSTGGSSGGSSSNSWMY